MVKEISIKRRKQNNCSGFPLSKKRDPLIFFFFVLFLTLGKVNRKINFLIFFTRDSIKRKKIEVVLKQQKNRSVFKFRYKKYHLKNKKEKKKKEISTH